MPNLHNLDMKIEKLVRETEATLNMAKEMSAEFRAPGLPTIKEHVINRAVQLANKRKLGIATPEGEEELKTLHKIMDFFQGPMETKEGREIPSDICGLSV